MTTNKSKQTPKKKGRPVGSKNKPKAPKVISGEFELKTGDDSEKIIECLEDGAIIIPSDDSNGSSLSVDFKPIEEVLTEDTSPAIEEVKPIKKTTTTITNDIKKEINFDAIIFMKEKIIGRTIFTKQVKTEFFIHWANVMKRRPIGNCNTCNNNFFRMCKIMKKTLSL